MIRKYYNTLLKFLTIALIVLTPVFVALDTKRLGYIPVNGAWFTWAIPALLHYVSEVD